MCDQMAKILYALFSVSAFAMAVHREALRTLVKEMLLRLLDESTSASEEGAQLVKTLNHLVMKILDNTNRNDSFNVLLVLLQQSSAELVDVSAEEAASSPRVKFTDLVMKCLWKVSKIIGDSIKQGKLFQDDLLQDIHGKRLE